jgi:hypothetical protein
MSVQCFRKVRTKGYVHPEKIQVLPLFDLTQSSFSSSIDEVLLIIISPRKFISKYIAETSSNYLNDSPFI